MTLQIPKQIAQFAEIFETTYMYGKFLMRVMQMEQNVDQNKTENDIA